MLYSYCVDRFSYTSYTCPHRRKRMMLVNKYKLIWISTKKKVTLQTSKTWRNKVMKILYLGDLIKILSLFMIFCYRGGEIYTKVVL